MPSSHRFVPLHWIRAPIYRVNSSMRDSRTRTSQWFFLLFLGPKFGPIPLAKKYVFSPILKGNSPQNEVFKKKNQQNVTTACRKCV